MTQIEQIHQQFNSLLSLKPLYAVLAKMIAEGKPGARKLYQGILNDLEANPQLLQPIEDLSILKEHEELVESLLSIIFPPATTASEGQFAVAIPFQHQTIYASAGFKVLFLTDGTNLISLPDKQTKLDINKSLLNLAFDIILRKFYNLQVPAIARSTHPFTDAETGRTRYFELKLNAQFVEVKNSNPQYHMPATYQIQRSLDMEELHKIFPLENFQFEGLVVIDAKDVTADHAIGEIKNTLLTINGSSDITVYDNLQTQIQALIQLTEVKVGITPFFKMNEVYLFSEAHYKNSLLYGHENVYNNKDRMLDLCQQFFKSSNNPVLYQSLNEQNSKPHKLLQLYYELGARSLILCPLKCDDGQLIGLLEIVSTEPGTLKLQHVNGLQPAMHLFTLGLEKSIENLVMQVDKTIKDHFTAIQNAVEWKFTEAAFNYLQNKQLYEGVKMAPITFEDVHPLYGAIDIRNSSVERNNAIQMDILEQLTMARTVLETAAKVMQFPLLKEIQFKIDGFIDATTDALLSEEELSIYDFLQNDLDALFKHIKITRPSLAKTIDDYFSKVDPQRNFVYHYRKEYEESITKINDVLDRFMDSEQAMAQKAYPHYFERYITDGIEFNIYVGQSLAPHQPFDEIYVKNLKLWQITMLAKAARLTNTLEKRLSLPLQTTQLILAHSVPLTISFRRKERKFDVDGAYNIRYEIIKKRIDKVHIKDTEERLTQPGKIAIVYSQQKDLAEYMEYISFLQNEGLLSDAIEHLELEDTQGISGLKALRVAISFSNAHAATDVAKEPASRATAPQLQSK